MTNKIEMYYLISSAATVSYGWLLGFISRSGLTNINIEQIFLLLALTGIQGIIIFKCLTGIYRETNKGLNSNNRDKTIKESETHPL